MNVGFIARKLGSVSLFDSNGNFGQVTMLHVSGCIVLSRKTIERDGYSAVQLAAFECKPSFLSKAQSSIYSRMNIPCRSVVKEIRVDKDNDQFPSEGETILPSSIPVLSAVKVRGISKGKGFAGVMKRYGFGGQGASHGVSVVHRSLGSTGQRTFPSRVFKGTKMPGRMGGSFVSIRGLKVVFIDDDKGLFGVRGSVPGHKDSIVVVEKF